MIHLLTATTGIGVIGAKAISELMVFFANF